MIVAFFQYLVTNGTSPDEITVLTFYNGQRKLILKKLRERRHLLGDIFKVSHTMRTFLCWDPFFFVETVLIPQYRLSLLTRTKEKRTLWCYYRLSEAIARARSVSLGSRTVFASLCPGPEGFLPIWRCAKLCKSSMLWWEVVKIMSEEPRRVGFYLPLTCEKHKEKTFIQGAPDVHD